MASSFPSQESHCWENPWHKAAADRKVSRQELEELYKKDKVGIDLKEGPKQWTPLHVATRCDNTVAVDFILDHATDVNAVDADGNAAIHLVHVLLLHLFRSKRPAGLQRDIQDAEGNTVLHLSIKRNSVGEVSIPDDVIDFQSCHNVQNNEGLHPIHL